MDFPIKRETIFVFIPHVFQVLDQMEMLSAFTDVLHVANLSTGAHLISILKQVRYHTLPHSHLMSLVYIAHVNP